MVKDGLIKYSAAAVHYQQIVLIIKHRLLNKF